MTSLTTAKILFFIALNVGPQNAPTVFATSSNDSYVWDQSEGGWTLKAKAAPRCDWSTMKFQQAPDTDQGRIFRAISNHDWAHNPSLDLDDDSRIEKRGDTVFYIVDPGAANEKVYTIVYPTDD
jgi:hypothetical protein